MAAPKRTIERLITKPQTISFKNVLQWQVANQGNSTARVGVAKLIPNATLSMGNPIHTENVTREIEFEGDGPHELYLAVEILESEESC